MTTPTILDILLQFLEQSLHILQQARPILQQLRNNEQVQQALKIGQDLYSQLPESVSLALTVAVIFVSSLMAFKVGRSVVGLLITLIQVAVVVLVAVVVWKLRDPLGMWLEQFLNQ
jgi:hypothetical protein